MKTNTSHHSNIIPMHEHPALALEIRRLHSIIRDLRHRLDQLRTTESARERYITVSTSRIVHRIRVSDIAAIRADSNYSHIMLADGQVLFTSKTLKHWEGTCSPCSLIRVHKSYLANKEYVTGIDRRHRLLYLTGAISVPYARSLNAAKIGLIEV